MMIGKAKISLTLLILAFSFLFLEGVCCIQAPRSSPTKDMIDQQDGIEQTQADESAHRQIEDHILRSTVRIKFQSWIVKENESGYEVDSSVGHATIKAGRYLVTHDHCRVPLPFQPSEADEIDYCEVFLYHANGELFYRGSLTDFELISADDYTLVMAYKGDQLFNSPEFESAEFIDYESVDLSPGIEVAQVDWDGEVTRVDWTSIQSIHIHNGVPRILLKDDILLGASGGGVFRNGVHIGINWCQIQELDAKYEMIEGHTLVKLNEPDLIRH